MVALMQNKLNELVGRSSGYIEGLAPDVRRRIAGLKGVQKEHSKLEAQFQEEVLELEKKYFKKFTPLYERRAAIINGKTEPSETEVEAGASPLTDDAEPAEGEEKPAPPAPVKGIPEFWLSSMKNNVSLQDIIMDSDEPALRHLVDIRMEYLDKPGFRLIFQFTENEFFTNTLLTKTYFYREENGYGGDFIYDHAEGDKIDWKAGKDLTVRIESKKQRNKSRSRESFLNLADGADTKQTRVIKKTVPTDSFFNFFSPPAPPTENASANSDIEERLELDYTLGEDIKEKIIPRAIDWFTGEALQYESLEDFEEVDFDEEDDEEDDSDERDDDEDESDDEGDESKPKPDAAECKQS
jgi:nucleosome assembly protein 1-like 1